jgi:hypothetical protein
MPSETESLEKEGRVITERGWERRDPNGGLVLLWIGGFGGSEELMGEFGT